MTPGLGQQPRLARARLPREDEDPALAAVQAVELSLEQSQLRIAADQRRGDAQGRAEQRHEAIAQELVDGSLQAMDFRKRELEECVEQLVHGFRAKTLGELCRVRHVAEQHGHLLALAFERGARRQDLLREVRRGVRARRSARGFRRRTVGQRSAAVVAESV